MKERPILFSAPMVRAILNGTKTQTRRIVKPQPIAGSHSPEVIPLPAIGGSGVVFSGPNGMDARPLEAQHPKTWKCPHGRPGDRLWVKETFKDNEPPSGYIYRATDAEYGYTHKRPWKPSIFMPRKASRITLEVTAVSVERLQRITTGDALAEGICYDEELKGYGYDDHYCGFEHSDPVRAFENLWRVVNGHEAWNANPWVWVIKFRRITA